MEKRLKHGCLWLGIILLMGMLAIPVFADSTGFAKVMPKMKAVTAKAYNSFEISWEPVEGADSYIVYYSTEPVSTWTRVKTNVQGTSYVHTSSTKFPIVTGVKYAYTVCAVKDGVRSKHEKGLSGVTSLGITALNKVTSINYNKLEISWKKVAGADGYIIYRKENGKWVKIGTAGASKVSFVHTSSSAHKIAAGTTYTYTVKAYRKTANGTVYGTYSKTGISGKSAYVSGWYTEGSDTYYYVNKKKVTGWKTIDGKMYYFSAVGKLQKNQIVGNAADGYWYVDGAGIRVTDSQIKQAVKQVTTLTQTSWSADQKLKKCFDYFVRDCVYERFYDKEDISKMPSYADYMFKNKKGNCYRGASALAYCAKVLGYETKVTVGAVSSSSGGMSVHGWTETKENGKWYMSDISMQRPRLNVNLYKILQSKYPFRLRVDASYTLVVEDGKVNWKIIS